MIARTSTHKNASIARTLFNLFCHVLFGPWGHLGALVCTIFPFVREHSVFVLSSSTTSSKGAQMNSSQFLDASLHLYESSRKRVILEGVSTVEGREQERGVARGKRRIWCLAVQNLFTSCINHRLCSLLLRDLIPGQRQLNPVMPGYKWSWSKALWSSMLRNDTILTYLRPIPHLFYYLLAPLTHSNAMHALLACFAALTFSDFSHLHVNLLPNS